MHTCVSEQIKTLPVRFTTLLMALNFRCSVVASDQGNYSESIELFNPSVTNAWHGCISNMVDR